jgi:hypothetical protein
VNRSHGHKSKKPSRTYVSWVSMKQRCTNPKDTYWHRYGGRGISVCDRWESFENFLDDMGERPIGTSLERRKNDEGYFKENCFWATPKEQAMNRSSTSFLTAFGETKTLSDWAKDERCAVKKSSFWSRLKAGWDIEGAIVSPANPGRRL